MALQQLSATTTAEITVRETQPDAYQRFLLTRAVVGISGLLLPLVLTTAGSQLGVPVQHSLSAYYHTTMGDYFVGSLIAIGTGLLVYMATRTNLVDKVISIAAGVVITIAVVYAAIGALDEDRGWDLAILSRRYLLLAERVAVYAFAISWALKGSEILSCYRGRYDHHLRRA